MYKTRQSGSHFLVQLLNLSELKVRILPFVDLLLQTVCVCIVGKGTIRELLRLKCSGVNIMANELLIEGKYKQLQN